VIQFTVHGQPQPAGSKRGFYNAKARRVIITDDATRSRPWKALVSDAAVEAMIGTAVLNDKGYALPIGTLLEGPLMVTLVFYVPRPKGHYGARGLKPSAPPYPTVKPDVLKLARAVEDALTGIVYRDDSQIVCEVLEKHYGEPARVDVTVDRIKPATREEAA
jgi:Holliday junction resolvase RusA-like endonuclease